MRVLNVKYMCVGGMGAGERRECESETEVKMEKNVYIFIYLLILNVASLAALKKKKNHFYALYNHEQ